MSSCGTLITSNDYMQDWKAHHQMQYLQHIVKLEALPSPLPLAIAVANPPASSAVINALGRHTGVKHVALEFIRSLLSTIPRNGMEEDEDISMGDLESNEWEDQVQTGFIGDTMRFVDSTGIFPVVGMLSQDLQLLSAQIYPATPGKPPTGFTFTVLEGFWLDALECKTAAMNFLSKLRRLTNCVFPLSVPDVYPAFMRCSHQYRNLKNLFKLYRPQVVTDGNFKLDNLKMRNPNDDVRLSDGEMFCVGSVSYEEHLRDHA
ncbi:hypothetical protein B0H14DRAFT_3168063 [Mycena olivaceomarginata]|nr:hypothetical protein B0H14DRAFT_3168063 [Mycena olivaceomarginata]